LRRILLNLVKDSALTVPVSLLLSTRELLRDQLNSNGDMYAFGISANRAAIEFFLDLNYQQSLTDRQLRSDEVSSSSTMDT
jgi:hypothetical protein